MTTQKNNPVPQVHMNPHLLLALSSLFWSGNFIVGRAISGQIVPLQFNFWRWLIALLLLMPFVYRLLYQQRNVLLKHWRFVLFQSATGIAGFHICVYQALQTTTAVNSLLFLSISPILIILGSRLLFHEVLAGKQFAGIVLSLIGVVVIITQGNPVVLLSLDFNNGDLWMLLAITLWSLYSLVLKHKPTEINQKGLLGVSVVIGVILMLPLYVFSYTHESAMVFSREIILGLVYVSLFASIAAYFFWNYGVDRLGPSKAGVFLHLMPLFGVVLSTVLLDEGMLAYHWLGAALIISGIFMTNDRVKAGSRT